MRRALATAVLPAVIATIALPGSALAENWKPFGAVSEKGLQWSYDADYSYRDQQSGKVVVMQAIGKVGAEPRLGPSGPGKPDGVGSVMALDCRNKTIVSLGGYAPKKPLELSTTWRTANSSTPKSAEDLALMEAACAGADSLPVK